MQWLRPAGRSPTRDGRSAACLVGSLYLPGSYAMVRLCMASVVNKRVPWLYSKGDSALAGFLVSPHAVELFCAYSGDGSTMNKMCDPPGASDRCMPGCPLGHDDTRWCTRRDEGNQCAWRGNQLDQMLMQQVEQHDGGYNEIVLDASSWERGLPHTISAVFYPSFAHDEQKRHARQIHASFLRKYALSSADVPLVEYNPRSPVGEVFKAVV